MGSVAVISSLQEVRHCEVSGLVRQGCAKTIFQQKNKLLRSYIDCFVVPPRKEVKEISSLRTIYYS